MNNVIYDPLEEYENKLKALHAEHTRRFFDNLVTQSAVDVEANRETVRRYNEQRESLEKLQKKVRWRKFWRVLMCISLVLIPLVFTKMNPLIRQLTAQAEEMDKIVAALLAEAEEQMRPLNRLFTSRDSLSLIESTIPLISFEDCLSVRQEEDMKLNYDFDELEDNQQSTVDVLAGHYNENPFLFESKLVHTMGTEIYHGYKTIHWTETYTDDDGKLKTRSRSQTLHATVTKPKPYYNTRLVLNYCSQGGPELSFSRDASHLHEKSEKAIERYVKRGERQLKRKTDKALRKDGDFMSMSNADFEVLFDALDRTNEVQFRTLFTPLAQTNMVSLLLSKEGYGDDFAFVKAKRTNRIVSDHSQGREMMLLPDHYVSHAFDTIQENFLSKNADFFKAVYFDFAPLWAIPLYQERPVHSLKPIAELTQTVSLKECETLANLADAKHLVHPQTKTTAILKSTFLSSHNNVDEMGITAYSYDIEPRIDLVPVYGDDGRWHNVPVEWDDYLPLEMFTRFGIAAADITKSKNQSVIAQRNGLCLFHT